MLSIGDALPEVRCIPDFPHSPTAALLRAVMHRLNDKALLCCFACFATPSTPKLSPPPG